MSIANNISRITNAKTAIKAAIIAKGLAVADTDKIDSYAAKISAIPTGVTPTGTINIMNNGSVDVTNYATASVSVPDNNTALIALFEGVGSTITVPYGTTTIRSSAFAGHPATTIILPDTITSLSGSSTLDGAFSGANVTSVTMPPLVTTLNLCFYKNTSITTLDLNNVAQTGAWSCGYMTNLSTVTAPFLQEVGGSCFYATGLISINLPSVIAISKFGFYNCRALTSVSLGSNVNSIFSDAFTNCTALTDITINKAENSVAGAPWGATNATVTWLGGE